MELSEELLERGLFINIELKGIRVKSLVGLP